MNLTQEQLAQCRKEFDAWGRLEGVSDTEHFWNEIWFSRGFKSAWRPVPTVDEIKNIIQDDVCGMCPGSVTNECNRHYHRCQAAYLRQAQAIHAAFGGKNE